MFFPLGLTSLKLKRNNRFFFVLDRVNDRGRTVESIIVTIICHGTQLSAVLLNHPQPYMVYRKKTFNCPAHKKHYFFFTFWKADYKGLQFWHCTKLKPDVVFPLMTLSKTHSLLIMVEVLSSFMLSASSIHTVWSYSEPQTIWLWYGALDMLSVKQIPLSPVVLLESSSPGSTGRTVTLVPVCWMNCWRFTCLNSFVSCSSSYWLSWWKEGGEGTKEMFV